MENVQNQGTNVMGLVGMILGILAIPFVFIVWPLGLILGIGGLVLSIIGRKHPKKGMATAGMVCSIIALALWLIVVLIIGLLLAAV